MSLEALVEQSGAGGWLVRSPGVGIYREIPPEGSHREGGESIGRLVVLGRPRELVLPAGVGGRLAEPAVHDRAVPVEYGQPLFRLAPSGAGEAEASSVRREEGPRAAAGLPEGAVAVICPIDGIFYRRPTPASPPFVEEGDLVEKGRTLGLIEAMKSFNAVTFTGPGLPERGEILEIRVADASEVRQGAILFVIRDRRPA